MSISVFNSPAVVSPQPPVRVETPVVSPAEPRVGAAPPPPPDARTAAAPEHVEEAVNTINENLVRPPLEAQYAVNKDAGYTVIKIVNTDSGEVLRQIPSESAVRLAEAIKARLTEAQHLVDEKA